MVEPVGMTMSSMCASMEEAWSSLDSLLAELSPADWQGPYGPAWTFADSSSHPAYNQLFVLSDFDFEFPQMS